MSSIFLTDFSDRISPMLVKELRQGMRAKAFIGIFLAMQVILCVMLFSAGAVSASDAGSVVSGIIFTFFGVAMLVVQPLRGTSALSSEVKSNTIEMMVLTRLSAWRIVFGKWIALVSQSALLLTTIIPYLILRYFFGGMNVVGEITALLLLFLTSVALTAGTVGLSGCSSVIVRSLIPIIGLPILMYSITVMLLVRGMGGGRGFFSFLSFDSAEAFIGVSIYLFIIAYLGASLLSLGASLIAPAAENHSLPRRLVALGLLLTVCGLGFLDRVEEGAVAALVAVIATPAMILAFTDSAPLVATVCKPFVKRGRLGKAVGAFLYPTWSSGVLAAIAIGLLGLGIISFHGYEDFDIEENIVIFSLFGGVLFPAVWQAFLFRGEGQRISHYLLLLAGSFVLLGVLSAFADSMNHGGFLWFFAWNPLAFLAMLNESPSSKSTIFMGVVIVDALLVLLLILRAFMLMRKDSSVIEEAKVSIQPAE